MIQAPARSSSRLWGRDGEAARPVEIRPQCETRSRLAELPQAGFKFFAVPVKVCAFGLRGA
jgi:hypothetical protein